MIVVKGFANAYNMDLEALMKCCVGELIHDGSVIPFCAYNTVGYREQVRQGRIDGQIKGLGHTPIHRIRGRKAERGARSLSRVLKTGVGR